MANNLTGDYEAVLQVRVRQINGLLATLHQNRAIPDASPSFPHRAEMPVGDPRLSSEISNLGQWLGEVVRSLRASADPGLIASGSPAEIGRHLAAKAPPGASAKLNRALEELAAARIEHVTSDTVRGRAQVQISTPTISLEQGSTSEVTVHVFVRAHYIPDDGTSALPAPIHGEVRVTYEVKPKMLKGRRKVLQVQIPSQDGKIQFFPAPGTGMTPAEVDKIDDHIRKAVRARFKPTDVNLPEDFQFFKFKALGSGAGQAIALPVQLSGAQAPSGGLQSVTNLFLGTSDFAIAVSTEYVKTQFQPTLDRLSDFHKDIEVKILAFTPTYHISVTSVDLQFKNGSIDLKVKAKATASWPWPDYNNIVITQRLTLVLNGQSVALQASDSDLTITGITGLGSAKANSRARTAIIAERDKALPDAQQALDDALQSASEQANHALTSFDDSASASYTALEITADGIIVRGAIDTKERHDPVVVIGETDDGKAFTALNSWIPGGRITGFEWSWLEATEFLTSPFNFGHYELKTASDEHRFIFPKPAAVSGVSGICLKVVGTQVSANGGVDFVSDGVGDACSIDTWLPPILVVPSWLEHIIGPLWLPDPPPDGILEESIAGHVNVLAQPVPSGGLTTNSLVHFAGLLADKPLEALEQGLAQVRRRDFALTFVVVMPKGTFATHGRREVEERLGSLGDRFTSGPLIITEDYVEGWTRTFGVAEAPASYIVNTRGEFVWKHEGKLDPNVLASALHKHLLPSQQRRALPMCLAVKLGERVLDATFDDDQGQTLALRRLRGQRVLLNFWQSWSAPCVRELRRLQRLQEETGPRAPFIVAVHGGGERRVLDEARRQNNLSFMLVHDSDQRIARMYGVQCWPTTLSINPDGIVDRIQFGIAHEHRAEARAQTA